MRIAIVTSVYYPMINGVAVFSHNLAMGLGRRGHEVMVITPSQTKKSFTKVQDGVKVVYLKSSELKLYPDQIHQLPVETGRRHRAKRWYTYGLKVSLLPQRQVSRALKEFSPEVVHVQGADPVGVAAVNFARKHQIPVVTTEHNQPEVLTEPLNLPKLTRRPVNNILTVYFKNRQKKSDYVTMPTKLAIEHLFHGQEIGVPVEAVSNGVDLANFRPGKAPEALYQKYQIPKERPVILYVGRVDPEKQIMVLLKAFRKFLDKHKLDKLSKTLFLVVGDGVDKQNLYSFVRENQMEGAVKFLGRVLPPDLNDLYRVGTVFATASEVETQGIVLIEAAASGLPLIAVDAGAVAEVCQDGQNGFLLRPGDTEAISEAMDKLLQDQALRTRMAARSVEIAQGHSLERTIDKYLEIYENLIKGVQK